MDLLNIYLKKKDDFTVVCLELEIKNLVPKNKYIKRKS